MSLLLRITAQNAIAKAVRAYGNVPAGDMIARGDFDKDGWYTDRTILLNAVPITYAECGCVFDWTPGSPPRVGRTFARCGDQQLDHMPLAAVASAEMNEHGGGSSDAIQAVTTTDGRPVDEVRAEQSADGNQLHRSYLVLSDDERAKGFVRPVRTSYRHVGIRPKHPLRDLTDDEKTRYAAFGYVKYEVYPPGETITGRFWTAAQLASGCRETTTMGRSIAETYARNPLFYGSTFCATCRVHLPVGEDGEFEWLDGSKVGS